MAGHSPPESPASREAPDGLLDAGFLAIRRRDELGNRAAHANGPAQHVCRPSASHPDQSWNKIMT